VYHHGKYASGGHYTVDVLRQNSHEWIHIDDTSVTPVSVEQVRRLKRGDGQEGFVQRGPSSASGHEGKAYLLLYKREDLVKSQGPSEETAKAMKANGSAVVKPRAAAAPASATSTGPAAAAPVKAPAPGAPPASPKRAGRVPGAPPVSSSGKKQQNSNAAPSKVKA
jgi:ubiquitin carboxyl-terminal hydrolase 10